MTVDVEDWPQSTLNYSLPIGERVVSNTRLLLELMDEAKVKATFFILGKVAERHPTLAREIAVAGHEIGTHGYSHKSIESMPVSQFKEELHRSVEILRFQTRQPVLGHRAADFSISHNSLHLFEFLANEGLTYDSSVFPLRHPRYGIPGAWRHPHLIRCASGKTLIEFPIATFKFAKMIIPGAGGGYLRLFPYWWSRKTLRALEREGFPGVCYIHPYELDVSEMKEIPYAVPTLLRWSQGLNRRSVHPKLKRLFFEERFIPMGEMSEQLRGQNLKVGLDLGCSKVAYAPELPPFFGHLEC